MLFRPPSSALVHRPPWRGTVRAISTAVTSRQQGGPMPSRILSAAVLLGIGGLLLGCDRACESSAQCGGGEVCVAATCQRLACDAPAFAVDPSSGACVALSSCFLLPEQRDWKACTDDPCRGQ